MGLEGFALLAHLGSPLSNTARSQSPTWHRRIRARRARGRHRLRSLALGKKTHPVKSEYLRLLCRDYDLLKNHHSKPGFQKVFQELQNYMWQPEWNRKKWNVWPKTPTRGKGAKRKEAQQGKSSEGSKFPGYDASHGVSSSSASGSMDGDLRRAMQSLVETNQLQVPEQVKELLSEGNMDSLKSEQAHLNKRKKLAAKLDRLKKARQLKTRQWAKYREDMSKKLKEEQDRFDREQQEITESIQETQAALDKLMSGMEDSEPESPDLEAMLQDPDKAGLMQELQKARKQNEESMKQMQLMQQQLQVYASQAAHQPQLIPSSPSQSPGINDLRDQKEEERKERQRRIQLVEDQKKRELESDRERSPRRDSQDSFNALG